MADNVVPIRRTATVEITAAPEPTCWEIMVESPERGCGFFVAIARTDAPTQEQALDLASLHVQELLQSVHPEARFEPC